MKTSWKSCTSPALLLDTRIALRNLDRMAEKAQRAGARLNPHFKTHQSAACVPWFTERGCTGITVSSLKMAAYFADAGCTDITVLFPVNIRDINRINALVSKVKLTLNVISVEASRFLHKHLTHPVTVLVEVDAGYGRTGISVNDTGQIRALLECFQELQFPFYGFYIHAGHTYDAANRNEVAAIHQQGLSALKALLTAWEPVFPELKISMGDTPACSMLDNFDGIDEIRPGNFIFYDLTMAAIGACEFTDIAVCMACPVVAKHESRTEIVVHGGAIHLSKDWLMQKAPDGSNQMIFGRPVPIFDHHWGEPMQDCYVRKLSQEHGIIKLTQPEFDRIQVGDLIGVLPVHSCLTADCMGAYLTETGDTIEMMKWREMK
ncbi:D-serine deaminase, pyridoxal phosphate-dependent [Cyclonatronum proteinivorum]|uniref:D-serine deaminase, pyridoxal phosphate-dependent n=1 Tax=Cyclonatronum proteinivorum TaxID=1457365 RepID=A0A345UNA8_9BACT|nr:alanine racemase [Cyclonatronum proteinivorum]AXJ01960.1 D-serine deaminase, pyridoxal phosphate-dependent [Cyclonatronum proteinivorum]